MVGFDLLYLNGYDLRKLPLMHRKALLKKLIAKTPIQFSESAASSGQGSSIIQHWPQEFQRQRMFSSKPSVSRLIGLKFVASRQR
jgi:ATP dependent DNA ligase-like protein